MPKERVTVLTGGGSGDNILIVAPHGPDDVYTAEMADVIVEYLDCHAVINNGFMRSNVVDTIHDKANCNNTDHCLNDSVVFEEFTKPILSFVDNWQQKQKVDTIADLANFKNCYIFYIHGMNHKNQYDCVIGYGKGVKEDRFTMKPWRVASIYEHIEISGYKCALGKAGGKYSARSGKNMAQLFRLKNRRNNHVESLQLEFSGRVRSNLLNCTNVAIEAAEAIKKSVKAEKYVAQLSHDEF